MAEAITKADLLQMQLQIQNHFDEKLDPLREELGDHAVMIESVQQKVRSLEGRPWARSADPEPPRARPSASNDNAPAMTRGDVKRVAVGLGLLAAVFEIVHYAGEMGLSVFKALTHWTGGQ